MFKIKKKSEKLRPVVLYNVIEDYSEFDAPGNVTACAMTIQEDLAAHAKGELIERLVVIERPDRPIAPVPHRASRIALVAIRVGVARGVEPFPDHALAVARRGEQAIHDLLIRLMGSIRPIQKRIHFLGRRRQAGQVQVNAADQFRRRSLRGRREPLARKPLQHKRVDRIARPRYKLSINSQTTLKHISSNKVNEERTKDYITGRYG